jgi:hypothetical protein
MTKKPAKLECLRRTSKSCHFKSAYLRRAELKRHEWIPEYLTRPAPRISGLSHDSPNWKLNSSASLVTVVEHILPTMNMNKLYAQNSGNWFKPLIVTLSQNMNSALNSRFVEFLVDVNSLVKF